MESEEDTIAAFMRATGCGYEEAFERLASCGGHLGRATSLFLNVDAGTSGTRPSPPPSPSQQVSDDDDDHNARRRSQPSGSGTTPATASASRTRRVSRWDIETTGVADRSSSGRSKSGCHRNSDGDGREPCRTRRRRRFREHISSDSDEEDEGGRNRNSRRRVLSSDEEFDYLKDLEELDSDDSPPPSPPPPRPRAGPAIKSSKASGAAGRHELAHRGGFHDAKVRAARERRWLLVNLRGSYDPASFRQARAVWGADAVARCVTDRFVLWQADAHAGGGEAEEAKKVLCYYGIPDDWIPAVVVVDPVTGQALEKLHGSDACELDDFLLRVGPYTDTRPAIPAGAAKNSGVPIPAGGVQSNSAPAAAATSPACSSSKHAGHASSAARNPAEPPVAAAAPTGQQQPAPAPAPSAVGNKACKLRVRLPDGRAVTKEFGGQCAVAELFAYCRSELGAGAAAAEKPFRLMRLLVGGAREEIGNQNASFESLRLHLSTVIVDLG